MFTPPFSRSRANDLCERPGKGGLIRKSGLRGNFYQRIIRFRQKGLRDLNALQNEVTMGGGPEGSPEGSRKMADRKPTLLGKCRQF